ncbi:nucleolar and spindle-associated protein 1 [Gastrophryne carolinensis]
MEAPSLQGLEALKYPELRKLAKQAGLKANLKADRLLKALKKHFYPAEQLSDDSDGNCTLSDKDDLPSCEEKEEQSPVHHVTNRRGRGKKGTKKEPTSLVNRTEQAKNEIQTPKDEQVQENNNEKIGEGTSGSGSASRQRKRRRTEDDVPEKSSDAKEKTAKINGGNSSIAVPPAGKIPRYTGRLSKAASKPSTPNFKKLHEAHFKRMESIDKYMERKQKRLDAVSNSIEEMKMLAKKSNLLTGTEKTPNSGSKKLAKTSNPMGQRDKTPNSVSKKSLQSRFYLFSPAPQKRVSSPAKTPASQKRAAQSSTASKSILVDKAAFKPTALSVSKMNVRFSETTKDNEHKCSLIKTPLRKSSSFGTPVRDARKSIPLPKITPESDACKSVCSFPSAATTPFKFSAQATATPNTNKKLKFDLQASLSRPLGYQPHKGKLKPWGQSKENQPGENSHMSALKNNYKQPPLSSSRDNRRKQHVEGRKVQRDKTVGTRRGIVR